MTIDVRAFLRENGFTVGDRGRFSKEMIALVNEKHPGVLDATGKIVKAKKPTRTKKAATDIVEDESEPRQEKKVFPKIPDKPVLRKQETLYALSGQARIGYDMCFRPGCFSRVSKCACPQGPKPPANAIPVDKYPRV